ncbi:MAG: heavy metal translocating P-type ATPase [Dehalococcoidia bacterium]|nr:heavy metal translocating P-type ATPase [Dehalococcoidia bacterium]
MVYDLEEPINIKIAAGQTCQNEGRDVKGGCSQCAGEEDFNLKRHLAFIISAVILFGLGMILRDTLHETPYGLAEYAVFLSAYLLSGWKVLFTALRNLSRGKVFDENSLMSIATIGAIAIHQMPEAVGVMLFFKVGELFQDLSVNRSRRSVRAVLDIRPDYANLKTDHELKRVKPEEVRVDDMIVVKPGEKIPLDGEVLEGNTLVDTSALTGESVPRSIGVGNQILAGMINKTGSLTVRVTKKFSESSVSRILELVENASSRKAPTENFITTFAKYYTPVVVFGALAVAMIPPLVVEGATFSDWIYRALVLLVISCPCALMISIPLGYFGGIGGAARKGILVKGANYLDALTKVKTVVFDKTGTLTKGNFKVTRVVPANGFREDELLRMAASAETQSNHPIARSILEAYGQEVNPSRVQACQEIPGCGLQAEVDGRTVLVGNDRLLHQYGVEHEVCCVEGTAAHLVVDNRYAGYIVIADEIKDDAREAIQSLKKLGVEKTVMLSGDTKAVTESVAGKLGIDVFLAELLPEDKVKAIEQMERESSDGGKIVFVGDGINDAPVIARADVGVAMGALGSDAAIETADVVIMTDAPSKLAQAIGIARKTRGIVWQNIIMALGVKGIFIALGIIGIATIWEAVLADVGVALLAILNATRAMR